MIGAEIVWVKMGSKVIGHVRDYGVPDCVERPTSTAKMITEDGLV